jgi:hypothetical protein
MFQVFDEEIDDACSGKFATREEADAARVEYIEGMGLTKSQAESVYVDKV